AGVVAVEPVVLEEVEFDDVEVEVAVDVVDDDVVGSVVGFVADVVVVGSVVLVTGLSESAQPAAPVTKLAAVAARKTRRSSVLGALIASYLEQCGVRSCWGSRAVRPWRATPSQGRRREQNAVIACDTEHQNRGVVTALAIRRRRISNRSPRRRAKDLDSTVRTVSEAVCHAWGRGFRSRRALPYGGAR